MTRRPFVASLVVTAAVAAAVAALPARPAAQNAPQASRIVATDASAFRPLTAVHGGAGNMAFAGLLNRGAIGPHFNFLHRGEIPVGSGIGHHFHNTAEEMFVILNGEAQFTVNGRTALLQGPVAVICRAGDSHAILNTGSETVQWMNFQVGALAGVPGDAFDLGDDRVGAAVDRVPTFMSAKLDRTPAGARGRGAATPPVASEVMSRRLFGPAAFRSPWAYVDHVLVAPGASTPDNTHASIGEAYYVLAGSGTVKLGAETAPVQRWNAIPVSLDETSSFTNTGTEPLELLVVGVARNMEAKLAVMSGPPRP
jgi:mannose-6-phosphate isomerase-like protein (cupin superfamily)